MLCAAPPVAAAAPELEDFVAADAALAEPEVVSVELPPVVVELPYTGTGEPDEPDPPTATVVPFELPVTTGPGAPEVTTETTLETAETTADAPLEPAEAATAVAGAVAAGAWGWPSVI